MASSPFTVAVARLLRGDESKVDIDLIAPFDAPGDFEPRPPAESDVVHGADAHVLLTLVAYRGGIDAKGNVRAPWRGICRRCSKEIGGDLVVRVSERFVEDLDPTDEEAYTFSHDMVDLADLVHDAIFLELPVAPLCQEDCKGLCPTCGIDRNDGTCECAPEVDPRWATLDALRREDPTGL